MSTINTEISYITAKNEYMNVYLSKQQAIIDMHERGFGDDFQLFGNNLLWVQAKIFIRPHDFTITEFYRFTAPPGATFDELLFGVVLLHFHIKGILLNDYGCYSFNTPPLIVNKLSEMQPACSDQ